MASIIKLKRIARAEALHKKVVRAYAFYQQHNPEASHHAICLKVAEKFDMARVSIHRIVEAAGLYASKRKQNDQLQNTKQ